MTREGHSLVVETGSVRVLTPPAVDWQALSMKEWLHRFSSILQRLSP